MRLSETREGMGAAGDFHDTQREDVLMEYALFDALQTSGDLLVEQGEISVEHNKTVLAEQKA